MTRLLLVFALLGLSACGFRPLYAGQSGSAVISGQSIAVEEIPGRPGYMLRQALIRELAAGLPGVDGASRLSIDLTEGVARAALLPDGAVSRSFINAEGFYTLETPDGPVSGKASVQVPYAATNSPYADVAAQSEATERAMEELSRRIAEQLRVQVQSGQ